MSHSKREVLRTIVRSAYDLQKLRIQMGNRIAANFRAKLGQGPGQSEEELDKEAKNILEVLRLAYTRITDGVVEGFKIPTPRQFAKFDGLEVITEYSELCLYAQYAEIERAESTHFARMGKVLEEFEIYTEFLKGVKGIGPAMAGVILSEFDIHKAEYPSSLWRYAGLDVAQDGRGRSRRKEHQIEVEYDAADGERKKRNSITFNPFLKSKLIGVLASSFLRAGENKYSTIYNDYKHRLETDPSKQGLREDGKTPEWSKGRRHNAALRYMVKCFLVALYNAWRPLEGLVVAPPYNEAKHGKKHKKAA